MHINKIVISRKELLKILNKVKETYEEICGMMLGLIEGDTAIVKEVRFSRNRLNSSVRFEIDPEDLYQIILKAEKKGLEIVAVFHSHPSQSYPSRLDKNGMKLWPIPWFIVNNIDNSYGCFILIDNEIKRIDIEIIDQSS